MEFLSSNLIWIFAIFYGGFCGVRYWKGKDPYVKEIKGTQEPDATGKLLVVIMFFFGALSIIFTIISAIYD